MLPLSTMAVLCAAFFLKIILIALVPLIGGIVLFCRNLGAVTYALSGVVIRPMFAVILVLLVIRIISDLAAGA